MIDVEGGFLPLLGELAVLATTLRPVDHDPAQVGGDVGAQTGGSAPLGSQTQEREQLGESDQALGFPPLFRSQLVAAILAIE